jgi:hypothetical protein
VFKLNCDNNAYNDCLLGQHTQLLHQVATLLRRELGSRGGEEIAGGRAASPVGNRKGKGDDRVSETHAWHLSPCLQRQALARGCSGML